MNQAMVHSLFDERKSIPIDTDVYHSLMNTEDLLLSGGTIYSLLKKQNRLHDTPEFFQGRLKQIYTDTLLKNIFIKNQTLQILNECEKKGIEVIPIKGPLFAEKYFGDIGARYSSDIDLFIRKEDLHNAIKCIKSLGFSSEKKEVPSHFNCGFYKNLPNSPCPLAVELHWNLVDENTSNIDVEAIWNEAQRFQSTYHYVKELSDHHAFYMICLHGWRHNLETLKYYLDIMQMIKVLSYSLDFMRVIQEATNHQTKKRLIRTLSIVYTSYSFMYEIKKFPYQIQKSVMYEKSGEKSLQQYINFLDYQFLSYDSVTHRLKELKQWLLPSHDEISILIGSKTRSKHYSNYIILYKKRISNLWKALW